MGRRMRLGRSATKPSGLIGHWRFDEIGGMALDTSGSGLHGHITGADRVAGQVGAGLNFDPGAGSTTREYVTIADPNGALDAITDAGTWMFWVKASELTDEGAADHYFCSKADAWRMHQKDNTQILVVYVEYDGGSAKSWLTNYTVGLATPAWHHIAVTYSKTNELITLYVDSSVQDTEPFAETLDTSATSLFIGGFNTADRTAKAILDDVRIYNITLSASEVEKIYNDTK